MPAYVLGRILATLPVKGMVAVFVFILVKGLLPWSHYSKGTSKGTLLPWSHYFCSRWRHRRIYS
jgi:hypothetical protein